jgi:hypothetical protein
MAEAAAPGDATTDLLATALALVEAEGWQGYSPLKLAKAARIGLAEACVQLPDQAAVLRALGRRADLAMLDIAPDELLEMSLKERVFEILMRRFEALEFAKPALRRLRREPSPEAWLGALGSLKRAMRLVVEASDAAPTAARGALAGAALTAVYLQTGRIWLDDDTPDRARTLAELDKRLDQAATMVREG